jgi:hypothetical protein
MLRNNLTPCVLRLLFSIGARQFWSVPQLPLGKHIQTNAKVIQLRAHSAGHISTTIAASIFSSEHLMHTCRVKKPQYSSTFVFQSKRGIK